MEKYRISLSVAIDCDNADNAQAIAGIVANVIQTMGAQNPRVSICQESDNPIDTLLDNVKVAVVELEKAVYANASDLDSKYRMSANLWLRTVGGKIWDIRQILYRAMANELKICDNPEDGPKPEICQDCPNNLPAIDGGRMCAMTRKNIY